MKRMTIIRNEKGEITVDFNGFQGKSCYEEAQRLMAVLEQMGVKVDIKNIHPKEDTSVQETQTQQVKEEQ